MNVEAHAYAIRSTNGPLAGQWALLLVVVLAAAGCSWPGSRVLVARSAGVGIQASPIRPDADGRYAPPAGGTGRRIASAVAAVGALLALVTVAVVRAMPGLVNVGFLRWMALPGAGCGDKEMVAGEAERARTGRNRWSAVAGGCGCFGGVR